MLLDVHNLATTIRARRGAARVVDDVSFSIERGEAVGLVGESGSGKSMTAYSLMRLFPTPNARASAGRVMFEGRDLLTLPESEMRRVRGARMSMIFQDPSSFLDPLMTVGDQIREAIRAHATRSDAGEERRRAVELLARLGLPDPGLVARRYPHQLSGGQKQRVMIATAIACDPALLIADEPTTALDVTVQAQIIDVLKRLRRELGLSILLITHDLGLVAEVCDRVYVMYGGRIAEHNTAADVFRAPRHPYTQGLLRNTLSIEDTRGGDRTLFSMPGSVPGVHDMPVGCRFRNRCPIAVADCRTAPPQTPIGAGALACWRHGEVAARDVWAAGEAEAAA